MAEKGRLAATLKNMAWIEFIDGSKWYFADDKVYALGVEPQPNDTVMVRIVLENRYQIRGVIKDDTAAPASSTCEDGRGGDVPRRADE